MQVHPLLTSERKTPIELLSAFDLLLRLIDRGDTVSLLWGDGGCESHSASACPLFSWCAAGTAALEGSLLCKHQGRSGSHDREMFRLMYRPWKSQQWGYLVRLGWIPPDCLSSLSTRLLGGARSSGRLPSEFLRERLAPWSSSRDTSSGLDRRAAMCSGESPDTLSPDTLLFTQAPEEEQNLMRYDVLTLQGRRDSDSSVQALSTITFFMPLKKIIQAVS